MFYPLFVSFLSFLQVCGVVEEYKNVGILCDYFSMWETHLFASFNYELHFRKLASHLRDSSGYVDLRLKTYAAISNAHLSRIWKQVKMSRSCFSTIYGFRSTQLSNILISYRCSNISLKKNKVMKVCPKYLLTFNQS